MKICFATNNPNKLNEIRQALSGKVDIISLQEAGCHEELPETQDTLEGNSLQKAAYVVQHYNIDCFADDTGLEVDALDGEPGVYSARYAGEKCNAEDNITKLLNALDGEENRKAQFRTIITLFLNGEQHTFEGSARGSITHQRSGDSGFGYDPVFQPEGYDYTFAEMSMEEKNNISHRGKAVQLLISFLKGKK